MMHNWIPVEAVRLDKALTTFEEWLDSYDNPVLIAHNANFDSRVLVNSYHKNMQRVPNILGFGDSLNLLKKEYPGLPCYRQSALVKTILKKNYDEHNAIEDVSSLTDLICTIDNFDKKLVVFTVQEVLTRNQRLENEHKFYHSYDSLIGSKHITKSNAKILSSSGLSVYHLKLALSRSGIDGLTTIIKDVVSNHHKVASSLFQSFQNS